MADVIEALREEHRNIERLLDALEHQIGIFAGSGSPDYDVITGIAEYFLAYPDRCHHPKEDAIIQRLAPARSGIDAAARLAEEHGRLHEQAARFRQTVSELLGDSDIARTEVVGAARDFIDAQRRHMREEEASLFTLAERRLDPTDWEAVEAAWSRHVDPLFGPRAEAAFRTLSERLLAWEAEDEEIAKSSRG